MIELLITIAALSSVVAAIIAVALTAYLTVALLKPEWFE